MPTVFPYRSDNLVIPAIMAVMFKDRQNHVETAMVYAVVGNTDTIEGKGASVTLSYKLGREEAIEAAKGAGPSGGDAFVREMPALLILAPNESTKVGERLPVRFIVPLDGAFDLDPMPDIRERALAKLSEVEKRALGLHGLTR